MGTAEEALTSPRHSAETLRRRKTLSRGWGALVIAWSFVRTAIVWAAVGRYGLDPWVYLGIDLASSVTDAFTTPRMVLAFIDDEHRAAVKWGLISLVAFLVPDLYIFLGTRHVPAAVIVIILTVILCTLSAGVYSVAMKIQKGRAARLQRRTSEV
jgi:hypothetical protein